MTAFARAAAENWSILLVC